MPKNRRRPRHHPKPPEDPYAFTPLVPRVDDPPVELDPSTRLEGKALERAITSAGATLRPWMVELEARVGGTAFGEHYARVWLGFRHAARQSDRTPNGEVLIRFGVEGDTLYFLTEDGEAWAQDGIADKHPHREAVSFDELAAKLCWPAAVRSTL